MLLNEVVGVAGNSSENSWRSDRATSAAAKGGDADLHVPALAVLVNQGTTAVTLQIKKKSRSSGHPKLSYIASADAAHGGDADFGAVDGRPK